MSFPRLFQRLFENDGAGPYLRKEIIPFLAGSVIMFSGTFGGTGNRFPIPLGGDEPDLNWVLCDGGSDGAGGTVPDLRGRMILGADETRPSGSTGGSERHDHSLSGTVGATTLSVEQVGSHNHASSGARYGRNGTNIGNAFCADSGDTWVGGTQYTQASGASGSHTHSLSAATGAANNMPPYYSLAFIMRVS
ncbi:MAG: hypothetical protein K2O70_03375 [Desulfovibrionaceae bacterium]|nr:hypothetical protein [Desulfovibrionaceae bacterium]